MLPVIALASLIAVSASDRDSPTTFVAPAAWEVNGKGRVVFYDAPDRLPGQTCRIAIVPPSALTNITFEEWFDLVQEPADNIEVTPVRAEPGPFGSRTLEQERLVEKGRTDSRYRLRRVYHGISDGSQAYLIIFTTSDDSLYRAHYESFRRFVESWNPRAHFPQVPIKEFSSQAPPNNRVQLTHQTRIKFASANLPPVWRAADAWC